MSHPEYQPSSSFQHYSQSVYKQPSHSHSQPVSPRIERVSGTTKVTVPAPILTFCRKSASTFFPPATFSSAPASNSSSSTFLLAALPPSSISSSYPRMNSIMTTATMPQGTVQMFSFFCSNSVLPSEPFVRVQGLGNRVYHYQHFKCSGCLVPLGLSPFYPINGLPYCETYGKQKRIEEEKVWCEYCKLGIGPNVTFLKALGKAYHEQCFLCVGCGRNLNPSLFYIVNDKPACESCCARHNNVIY